MICDHDTIAAPATAAGGALAVIRVSGGNALTICDRIFRGSAPLADAGGYTVHYGHIMADGRTLDDVLVTVFRAPHSYTGEDAVEISCRGSRYIVRELLALLVRRGARMATPGEFTSRAFLGGKLDLSQAEAVADLIASGSRAAHTLATDQMRGGYSAELETLRGELLRLASLLDAGLTPVFSAIMHDGHGTLLNCNADSVASSVALGAARIAPTELVFCFEKSGVLRDPEDETTLIREITAESYAALKAGGIVSKGMIPKVENALKAVANGVRSVTIKHSENLLNDTGTVIR